MKPGITRRMFGGAAAAVAAAGPSTLEQLGKQFINAGGQGMSLSGTGGAWVVKESVQTQINQHAVTMADARKILMGTPWMIEKIRDEVRASAPWPDRLDPDIANKRSWSPAVKMAAQRERNIEKNVKIITSGSGAGSSFNDMLFSLMRGEKPKP